ncbi:30S ribosomal protein S6 [Coprothermobacter proteolyticus]|uniref:30S ribosomal protein S6 n=1 Tax=Coprothermobacter proteolyticus TaxID=35786 RepID=UPI000D2FE45D|nr:30S ribosomal protein S6 [Coprothermobacter proteolyticus]
MNRRYELMVIYRAEDDNGYQEGNDWVTEKVQSYQGQVTKLDPWGLRRLAYPIEKRTQAYYSVFQIELPVENLDEFSQDLKVDERILRFMITRGE